MTTTHCRSPPPRTTGRIGGGGGGEGDLVSVIHPLLFLLSGVSMIGAKITPSCCLGSTIRKKSYNVESVSIDFFAVVFSPGREGAGDHLNVAFTQLFRTCAHLGSCITALRGCLGTARKRK